MFLSFFRYNGDFFDWPFLNDRCKYHGISLEDRIGFSLNQDVYTSRFAVHIDCFAWVQRDSYLPQGSQGLKAVTRAKLDYEPVEVDPEEMVAFAQTNPQTMATYSVSDAVATYYLYQKYVQPFIFSLCNIIPMTPDDVLRKGSGTLCEVLLMVSAFRGNIICPNKTVDEPLTAHGEHYLDTQTYVGGHVEALQSGVYRSDLKYKFKMDPAAFDELIANLDRDLEYALMVGHRVKRADVVNYEEKRQEILDALLALKATPRREENPLIIHLDVGAMYPNIILSNRLQPPAMVKPETCAACDYFSKIGECRRDMKWDWRAEAFPATKADVRQLRGQMNQESREAGKPEPSIDEIKVRIRKYSQMVYKKQHKTIHEERTANVCQRENPFYVNTVLEFKERRMVYKGEKKSAEGRLKKAMAEKNALDTQTAEKMVVLYESLQLAHKCILNSFYGYVMRKGARWYSMEMAGVVTHLGANIIRMARELIERIGIPLELDTDGIWCCLPASFPQGIKFVVRDSASPGKTKNAVIQYGCEMLNAKLEQEFTNHQYHVLDPKTGEYTIKSECSIAFELDGPYLAMILPASTQEDKRLKKRYAVFNHNKTLAELKGFEIKRRGELQLIKNFQEMVFKRFLDGGTLEECYSAVSNVANEMLDIIDERGQNMEDEALLNIISESSTMSRALLDYGAQKSCAITTAKRLGEVLGEDTVKDKGLQCRYIVSKLPEGSPVTERAVPVKIFMMDKSISLVCLKRWLKDSSLKGDDVDIRNVLDWG
jgi:DNA polymerase epsilon subunit 1